MERVTEGTERDWREEHRGREWEGIGEGGRERDRMRRREKGGTGEERDNCP